MEATAKKLEKIDHDVIIDNRTYNARATKISEDRKTELRNDIGSPNVNGKTHELVVRYKFSKNETVYAGCLLKFDAEDSEDTIKKAIEFEVRRMVSRSSALRQ